ncbi:MAG: methylated-DNA--[protein]-cysteine S-methyltransferase [Bdellovibrionota bacterium]
MDLFWSTFESNWGNMLLVSNHRGLVHITLPSSKNQQNVLEGFSKKKDHIITHKENSILYQTKKQLEEYFAGKSTHFNLPLHIEGTPFQTNVWNALRCIPFGTTWSYKKLATFLDNPKAIRAVGNANNKNPLPIVLPCHRVIGSNGDLVGYAGGVELKKKLIAHEASTAQLEFGASGTTDLIEPRLSHITPQH